MRINKHVEVTEARKSVGRFFRVMLREVKPEHVPDMIHTLWAFGHTDKAITVPDKGRWRMKMPHGYALLGEGPVGTRIEPPPGQQSVRVEPRSDSQAEDHQPLPLEPRLDEHDTQAILALCELARKTARPERDRIISQIFALRLDRCRPNALDAVELLIYDLIANKTE